MIGAGRLVGSTSSTIFKAGASLGANPVIKLAGTQGTRAENLSVDCNSVSGSTGLYATDINEQGGFYNLTVVNCPAFGINVDATAFSSIPAQGYTVRDVEIFPQWAGIATTIGLQLKGNGGGGPQEVRNVVASGASGHVIQASVFATNWNGGHLANIHGEFATNVLQIPASGISSFILDQISGTTTDTNVVNINAASEAGAFSIREIVTNAGGTNAIVDGPRGITCADQFLSQYNIGAGGVGSADVWSTNTSGCTNNQFTRLTNFPNGIVVGRAGATVNKILYLETGNITPAAVTANTCSDQTFAVTGLVQTSDLIGEVKYPTGTLGNLSLNGLVSANNTILLHFCNPSAANATPPAGNYGFVVFR